MPQPPSNEPKPTGIAEILNEADKAGQTSSTKKFKVVDSKTDGWATFKHWLGKKGFQHFLQGLSQFISHQMKKEQQEAEKAQRRLKASEEGKPDPD